LIATALLSLLAPGASLSVQASPPASLADDTPRASLVEGSLRVPRGSQDMLWIPDGERLEFAVILDLGLLGKSTVGEVTMSSGVEPFLSGLPLPGQPLETDGLLVGWVEYTAHAKHFGIKIDNTLTTRFLPTMWPSLIHNEVQTGRKNRIREIKIGQRDGLWTSEYRPDEHCKGCRRKEHFVVADLPWNGDYHCKDCKRAEHRLPAEVQRRDVPPQTLDILGTVYLARNLMRTHESQLTTMMVKKQQLWELTFKRGEHKQVSVPAGSFPCQAVRLDVKLPPGEDPNGKAFSGLFGIRGVLTIWMHAESGVPVMIEGDVPAGSLLDLHAIISLKQFDGVPQSFHPLP